MSTKSKSALSETPNHKASPATPRVSKLGKGATKSDAADSASPQQNPRISIEKSPRSVTSKPTIDRRSPKLGTPPDKKPTRILKPSELQAELNLAQEDLKKAKEKLVVVEKEKAQAVNELHEAQRLAEEANEKLREAVVAQKRAEESSEIEKFRAVEMEQAGIEAAQKKEAEWQKELEAVKNQHALDVAALLSATEELQKVKQELAMTSDAKNQALSHADDATKIAEIHAEKVEMLSAEIVRLKSLLDSKTEQETNENNKLVAELKLEIETLRQELDKAKGSAERLLEKEATIEQINVELEAAKLSESYARNLVEEWKKKVEELEVRAEEASRLERSASESMESVMKQLEGSNHLLHDAESEIACLKEKVGLLEISVGRQKGDLEESELRFEAVKNEASEMAKKVESLTSQLETLKEEKSQALNNEKLAAASVQNLLEEKNSLITEIERLKDEEEKSKKAMESLASALHEVSGEAREAKEKLLSSESQRQNYENQIEDLNLVLKATKENYESMLDDAKQETDVLIHSIEQSKHEYQKMKDEWEQKELHFVNCIKKSEEEKSSVETEVSRLLSSLREAEQEIHNSKEEESKVKKSLKEVESEVDYLKEVLGEAKAETMKLKESLMDKENELQNVLQENEELRTKEAASVKKVEESLMDKENELQNILQENEELRTKEAVSVKKVEELSKLLEEAKAVSVKKVEELSKLLEEALAKQAEENGDVTDSEKDYDMLPKVVEFSEQNGGGREEKPLKDFPPEHCNPPTKEEIPEEINNGIHDDSFIQNAEVDVNGKPKVSTDEEKEDDDSVKVEFKMWESCKIDDKDFSPEKEEAEQESLDEEVDLKTDAGESYDQINGPSSTENIDNGGSSPSKQQSSQKKKKPLLRKFGSLLKKKSPSSQSQK